CRWRRGRPVAEPNARRGGRSVTRRLLGAGNRRRRFDRRRAGRRLEATKDANACERRGKTRMEPRRMPGLRNTSLERLLLVVGLGVGFDLDAVLAGVEEFDVVGDDVVALALLPVGLPLVVGDPAGDR